jgi:hypothetical protein
VTLLVYVGAMINALASVSTKKDAACGGSRIAAYKSEHGEVVRNCL